MAAMATPVASPREYITPEAFRVADHLIGVPLAKPSRRLGAMLIDLLLVALLTGLLDAIGLLIALVGSFLVFRLSRGGEGRWYRRFYRKGLGCFGALLTFVAIMFVSDFVRDQFRGGDDDDEPTTIAGDSAGNVAIEGVGFAAGTAVIGSGYRLRNATRPGERDTLADQIVSRLVEDGLSPAQIRPLLPDLLDDAVLPPEAIAALEAAVETTSARMENRPPRSAAEIARDDSVATERLAEARADSAAAMLAAAGGDTVLAAARDTIRQLNGRMRELESDLALEEQRRAAAEERFDDGAVRWVLSSVSDELGLGLGWLGLYFTAFLVLGGGQTPGKRLFRLRVIRLDGRAIGWWTSLQRFGGYSASVFTGLLGFAEMIWDENRQALQDKLVHTVVIQEPKQGTTAPAVEVPFAGDEPVGAQPEDDVAAQPADAAPADAVTKPSNVLPDPVAETLPDPGAETLPDPAEETLPDPEAAGQGDEPPTGPGRLG
ncbi:MAG TPA: RDD family protein [Longimicrobiales bacterium]